MLCEHYRKTIVGLLFYCLIWCRSALWVPMSWRPRFIGIACRTPGFYVTDTTPDIVLGRLTHDAKSGGEILSARERGAISISAAA